LNREKLYRTLTTLDIFVDKSLRLEPKSKTLSGFQYNCDLIYAATVNTYLETVGNKADSIHLAVKSAPASNIYWVYLKTVELLGKRCKLNEKRWYWLWIILMKSSTERLRLSGSMVGRE
jgi:hypothetical protein